MTPIRRNATMVSTIARELRDRISSGQLQPGQLLPPMKDLAEEFDVGLSTVREAVQMLTAMGLLESRPGRGTWVPKDARVMLLHPAMIKERLTQSNARQVYEARAVIEVALTRLAAQRARPEDIHLIEQAMAEMHQQVDDTRAFVRADLDFHLSVARAAHSQVLEQFYYSVREFLPEVISELVILPQVKEESLDLQDAILQAIRRHDEPRAVREAQKHMEYIERLLNQYE